MTQYHHYASTLRGSGPPSICRQSSARKSADPQPFEGRAGSPRERPSSGIACTAASAMSRLMLIVRRPAGWRRCVHPHPFEQAGGLARQIGRSSLQPGRFQFRGDFAGLYFRDVPQLITERRFARADGCHGEILCMYAGNQISIEYNTGIAKSGELPLRPADRPRATRPRWAANPYVQRMRFANGVYAWVRS